ncbi:unnamed protein product [Coccothraustes coccothraustes]
MLVCNRGDDGDGKPGPVPHLLPQRQGQGRGSAAPPRAPSDSPADGGGTGEQVVGARWGGQAPRKEAARGNRGERRGPASQAPSVPAGALCVRASSFRFPLFGKNI